MAGRPLTFTLCGTRWVCGGARPSICWSSLTPRICQTHWISFRPERRHVFWWMFFVFCPWGKLSEGPPKLLCFRCFYYILFFYFYLLRLEEDWLFCLFFFSDFAVGFLNFCLSVMGCSALGNGSFYVFFQWRHHCCLQFSVDVVWFWQEDRKADRSY